MNPNFFEEPRGNQEKPKREPRRESRGNQELHPFWVRVSIAIFTAPLEDSPGHGCPDNSGRGCLRRKQAGGHQARTTTGPRNTGPRNTGPRNTGPRTTSHTNTGPRSTGPRNQEGTKSKPRRNQERTRENQ